MYLFDLKLSTIFTCHLSLRVGGHLAQARVMTHDKPSGPWDKSDVMLLLHASKKKSYQRNWKSLRKQNPVVRSLDLLNDINECAN
jgi:hypothetical protein